MVKIENYPKAYKEVYVILKYTSEEDLKLIPEEFINMLEENMDKGYKFELDSSISFENQKLLTETKSIFAYIFLNYWGTESQKELIKRKFMQDININEKKKRDMYNRKELFEKKKLGESIEKETAKMIEYKKENIIIKIINRINKFFYL